MQRLLPSQLDRVCLSTATVLLAIVLLGGGPLLSTALMRQCPNEPSPNSSEEVESESLLGEQFQRRIRRESPTRHVGALPFTAAALSILRAAGARAAVPSPIAVEHALRNGMGGPLRC